MQDAAPVKLRIGGKEDRDHRHHDEVGCAVHDRGQRAPDRTEQVQALPRLFLRHHLAQALDQGLPLKRVAQLGQRARQRTGELAQLFGQLRAEKVEAKSDRGQQRQHDDAQRGARRQGRVALQRQRQVPQQDRKQQPEERQQQHEGQLPQRQRKGDHEQRDEDDGGNRTGHGGLSGELGRDPDLCLRRGPGSGTATK